MKNKNKKLGFTLIELLVVIVIIGILAGIGIATFKESQHKAEEAKKIANRAQFCKKIIAQCVSNLAENCISYDKCLAGGAGLFDTSDDYVLFGAINPAEIRTIKFKAKIDDPDNRFIFFEDRHVQNRYILASVGGANLYHQNNDTPMVITVDGSVVTSLGAFVNDGMFHDYEVSNVGLSTWSTISLSGYSGFQFSGKIADLEFFGLGGVVLGSYQFLDIDGSNTLIDVSGNDDHGVINNADLNSFFSAID